eukprot:15634965-Heterocapsa_arctica.AAC.1
MGSAAHDETGRPVEFEDLCGQDLPPSFGPLRHAPPADPAAEPEARGQRRPAPPTPTTPHREQAP